MLNFHCMVPESFGNLADIGGILKATEIRTQGRFQSLTEPFLSERDCHRNYSFTLREAEFLLHAGGNPLVTDCVGNRVGCKSTNHMLCH